METNILKRLIEKYLKGECTPEEVAVIHDWYDSFEEEQGPENLLSFEQQANLKQRLFNNIKAKVASANVESKPVNIRKNISGSLIYLWSGVAAMLVLTIGVFFFNQKPSHTLNSQNIRVVNMTKAIQKLVLSDGSTVWLNPGSKVNYPENFTTGERKVQMQGEAFFEVSPDTLRPFIIYSGNVITRVWGTSFRIRAYENTPVEVSVLTGKVSVQLLEKKASELILLPNQKATYMKDADILNKDLEMETSAMSIWQKETMAFDNQTIREVINVLNRQFNVNITVEDEKLLSYVLKADFTDQSLPSILEMLQKSLGVEYELNDQQIKLYTNHN